ncbi:MAG: hypothetical protein F4Z31_07090 [Gemmatimonadetes bacterium]|nr:hypothetical protein [Gemmatimonadota bacterium]MYE94061.1 hypothetical protein [Gemmatimonadota bacterium]MYJ12162.1 hypothetical protein [Gemmatimonadota bacterium]
MSKKRAADDLRHPANLAEHNRADVEAHRPVPLSSADEDSWLQGAKCPKCGHHGRFRVVASIWVDLTDDGSVPSDAPGRGDHEWDDDATTECPKCDHMAPWAAFRTAGSSKHQT